MIAAKSLAPNCKIMWRRCYGNGAMEEWSTPVNWEEDPAIKAKRPIAIIYFCIVLRHCTMCLVDELFTRLRAQGDDIVYWNSITVLVEVART